MSRRLFLERFATLVGAGVGSGLASSAAKATEPIVIELQQSPVAGFQYHQGNTVWAHLANGAPLELVREPDNRYDKRAVRVEWRGEKLGYVPRAENATLCHLLDSGHILSAVVVRLAESDDPWKRIEFAVNLRV